MDPGTIGIIGGAITAAFGAGGFAGQWLAKRQTREGAVDQRMLSFIDTLNSQVERLTKASEAQRVQLEEADKHADEIDRKHRAAREKDAVRISKLEERGESCERRMGRLMVLMTDAGIAVPHDLMNETEV